MVDGDSRLHSARPRLEWLSDIVVACGLIALFLPLMIIVATAIKCGSPGPVLVWEKRVCPRRRRFWALKFRCTAQPAMGVSCGERDTTFVGGIIHFLRIDALPQLVNVLRGEMTCFPTDPDYLFFLE